MKATIDSLGRVVIPKTLRDTYGLQPGAELDLSPFGSGLHLEPVTRAARLVPEGEHLVVAGDASVSDDDVFALIDAGRR